MDEGPDIINYFIECWRCDHTYVVALDSNDPDAYDEATECPECGEDNYP